MANSSTGDLSVPSSSAMRTTEATGEGTPDVAGLTTRIISLEEYLDGQAEELRELKGVPPN